MDLQINGQSGGNYKFQVLIINRGWLAFNSGSTFGVTGNQWRLAAKAAGQTMVASFGGGIVAVVMSFMQGRGG